MFIQTEETPNPAVLKFLPSTAILSSGNHDYRNAADASASPLAQRLFRQKGVAAVFLAPDFIAVTKDADAHWPDLKANLLGAIMDHFTSGLPVVEDGDTKTEPAAASEDSALIQQIKELLDHKIRPAVAQDGGDIVFDRFDNGILYLQLRGACAGCPSSSATLKAGVENMMKHYLPEVLEVRQSAA
jgi:NFU1 iron-sulfur cluster scaffold homolog, mitochondrial